MSRPNAGERGGVDILAVEGLSKSFAGLSASRAVSLSLIMTSSELEEVVGIADIVVTMYRGRLVAHYERDTIAMARVLADITHPTQAAA